MPVVVAPDAELVAVDYARAHPDLQALGVKVGTSYPARRAGETDEQYQTRTLPLVVVSRAGGVGHAPVASYRSRPRLDFDAYAATKTAARRVAATAEAVMDAASGAQHAGGLITSSASETGLSWLPDPVDDSPRYVFTVRLELRPV